jgi:pyruvate/2-oxoglutarate dehydrogenase complex dihydrolipoamide dehydrogenase (E3) component
MNIFDYIVIGAGPAGLQLGTSFNGAGATTSSWKRPMLPGRFFVDSHATASSSRSTK